MAEVNPESGAGEAGEAEGAAGETIAGPMTVVRPELIVRREVVAVTVPEVVIRDGESGGRWRVYLRIPPAAEGQPERREARPMAAQLDLGDGRDVLWVHPVPAAPSPSTPTGWTAASRKAWLEGTASADPCTVFDALCAALAEYLDVEQEPRSTGASPVNGQTEDPHGRGADDTGNSPDPLIATLALWTMLTYAYVAWDAVPYLFVNGPAGSGKTRVFELLSRLAFRPLSSSNLSAAALFRTLHDRGGTLLLDEAERLAESGDDVAELRSILLAGYKRGGRANRLESNGDDTYHMREFQVFGPKAIACINALPPALASRCITVQMFRSPPGSDKPRRRIDADPARWQALRDQLHLLTLGELGEAAPAMANLPGICPLGGRQYELWQPILALASWVDFCRPNGTPPSLHPQMLAYAQRACEGASEGGVPEEDYVLLCALTSKVLWGKEPNCKEILELARRMDADAVRGISARKAAEVLKRYGLHSTHTAGRNVFRDVLDQIKRIEVRYGIDLDTAGKDRICIVSSWRSAGKC